LPAAGCIFPPPFFFKKHRNFEGPLEEIQELQPSSPYYLGGFCMGGLVALEMAQRLI
jgi:surfactin synthase thioesterase subunit